LDQNVIVSKGIAPGPSKKYLIFLRQEEHSTLIKMFWQHILATSVGRELRTSGGKMFQVAYRTPVQNVAKETAMVPDSMKHSLGRKVLLIGGIGVIGIVLLAVFLINKMAFEEDYKKLQVIQVGMTEQEVVNKLGPPYRVYFRETAPKHYYVPGYSFKERDITNKVLIYTFTEPIAYYYIDGNSRVEAVFIGGS
jgi:hypothetical protein